MTPERRRGAKPLRKRMMDCGSSTPKAPGTDGGVLPCKSRAPNCTMIGTRTKFTVSMKKWNSTTVLVLCASRHQPQSAGQPAISDFDLVYVDPPYVTNGKAERPIQSREAEIQVFTPLGL